MMPIQNRNYFGAMEAGRQSRQQSIEDQNRNALAKMELARQQSINTLMQDPAATPEQFARAGRTDISNYMVGRQKASEVEKQQQAKMLFQAAQYGLQSANPKEFIRQNYPELAKLNPTFETDTDEQIKASLQQAVGIFGPQAGIGPEAAKGRGPLYKVVDPVTGEVTLKSAEDAAGETPYIYKPPQAGTKPPPPPRGYRYKADGSVEPIPGGPNDPNAPNRPTQSQKPPTESDKRARVMYRSMQNAEKQLEKITTADTSNIGQAILGKLDAGKVLQSQEYKGYKAAGLRWAANLLYLKSGATATDAEIESTWMQFFPQPGDGQAVKDQKNEARQQEIDSINEAYSFESRPSNGQQSQADSKSDGWTTLPNGLRIREKR